MTLMVQQHIVQLQVPLDKSTLVEKVERQTYLGAVKLCVLLGQSKLPLHVVHQITAANKLNHEEESARSL